MNGKDRTPGTAIQKTFRRRETKFILDSARADMLLRKLGDRMSEDRYGLVTVLSVSHDSPSFDLMARSADKPEYKEKFRLRSYGVPSDGRPVFAEIKKKYAGIVYKRRTAGTPEQIGALLERGELMEGDLQIQNEILHMNKRYGLRPAVLIAYDRMSYVFHDEPSLRLTMDSNIRYRLNDLDLRKGDAGLPLRDGDFRLMEIKSGSNFPLWLTGALEESGIRHGSFSKVGTCYKEVILPQLRGGKDAGKKVEHA